MLFFIHVLVGIIIVNFNLIIIIFSIIIIIVIIVVIFNIIFLLFCYYFIILSVNFSSGLHACLALSLKLFIALFQQPHNNNNCKKNNQNKKKYKFIINIILNPDGKKMNIYNIKDANGSYKDYDTMRTRTQILIL